MSILRRSTFAGLALLAAVLLASCGFGGLQFRVDDRVEIVSPQDREVVTVPFEVEWTVEGLDVAAAPRDGTGVYFAVFVDRTPMGPGRPLEDLADEACERDPQCPNEQWLADNFVLLTTDTSLTIDRLPARDLDTRTGAQDLYEITIVLMDEDDERIGESAFRTAVQVRDPQAHGGRAHGISR